MPEVKRPPRRSSVAEREEPPLSEEDAASVRARLGAPAQGWTNDQAARLLAENGPNVLATDRTHSRTRLLLRQFASPIEIILVAATVLAGVLGDGVDATIILVILLLAGLLGFAQEWNAGRTMDALLATVEVTCRVRRSGTSTTVPLTGVVRGDVVDVGAGDLIPADCLVLEANRLTVDESTFTGETYPASKRPRRPSGHEEPGTEEPGDDAVYFGCHVASGTGTLLVMRTGSATRLAGIAAEITRQQTPTGFEAGMTRFGLLLTRVMIVLVVVIFIVNMLLQRPALEAALFSLALAVGLTPQLLPAIVAIGLAHGARAMAADRVIVRRLDAIEDFGSMAVLCCDKTGTLTEGRISLVDAFVIGGDTTERVRRLAALNAALHTGWDNPIDSAILDAAPPDRAGVIALGEVPYDFQRKRQSVLARLPEETSPLLITKGSLSSVLSVCATAAGGSGAVPLATVEPEIRARYAELSAQGHRVLGVAIRPLPATASPAASDETAMEFAGLLAFSDPVKPDAADVAERLAGIGVSLRMITGDNELVARHIGAAIGIDTAVVYTGADVDAAGDAALTVAVEGVHVFCDINPVQKERVIRAFRRAGHVVGYLGDGINDAPALRAADVGITVDTAAPVAKQAASVVLLDKELAVILDGIRQGRRTFENTMKYIFITTSANFGNMLSMAVAAPLLPFLPLLAGQILAVNLLSDAPALAIAGDRVDEQRMARPHRWSVPLIRSFMIVFGALSSVFDLLTFALLRIVFHAEAAEFRSAWFVGSVLTEVGVLLVLRTRLPVHRSLPSRSLAILSIGIIAVTIALPFSPVGGALGLVPLPLSLLGLIGVVVLVYLAANEIAKRLFWARHTHDDPGGDERRVRRARFARTVGGMRASATGLGSS